MMKPHSEKFEIVHDITVPAVVQGTVTHEFVLGLKNATWSNAVLPPAAAITSGGIGRTSVTGEFN